jgi:hypothetical protein
MDETPTTQEKLMEVGAALQYALEHPATDDAKTLQFGAQRLAGGDPISRGGGDCPRSKGGMYSLSNLVEFARLVQKYAGELGSRAAR